MGDEKKDCTLGPTKYLDPLFREDISCDQNISVRQNGPKKVYRKTSKLIAISFMDAQHFAIIQGFPLYPM